MPSAKQSCAGYGDGRLNGILRLCTADFADQPVADLGYRFDNGVIFRVIAESLPKLGDRIAQCFIDHDLSRPHFAFELFTRDHFTGSAREVEKEFHGSRLESRGPAFLRDMM
jgi:hypothetical protein